MTLPGMDAGKRVETVEWGLRQTSDGGFLRKGEVDIRPSEENAHRIVAAYAAGERNGWRDPEIVRRTIVTYTSDWERG